MSNLSSKGPRGNLPTATVTTPYVGPTQGNPNPLIELALIAAADLALCEDPKGSNRGPALEKFFEADDLVIDGKTDGYAWCACAASYWIQQFLKSEAGKLYSMIKPPRTARAFDFDEAWGPENECLIFSPSQNIYTPRPGDIAVWNFSHVSIVERANRDYVVTIDGNSNDDHSREGYEVARGMRRIFGPQGVRHFVRLLPDAARQRDAAPSL